MRVRIIFNLNNKGGSVPFHHQFLLADLFETLKAGTEKYAEYNQYNFSGIKGQTKVGRNGLHYYSSKVTIVFASPSKDFIDAILRELFKKKFYEMGYLNVTPESVEIEKVPDLSEEQKYICISPLVIAQADSQVGKSKQFVNPMDDMFSDYLYESTLSRMEALPEYQNEDFTRFSKFQVLADKGYLDKIRASEKKFSRVYPVYLSEEKAEVRGYTFPFTLYADKTIQKFIFETGFGEHSQKGFGMLDIANADPIDRVQPYKDYLD